jgi:hypothetical protein
MEQSVEVGGALPQLVDSSSGRSFAESPLIKAAS